MEQPYLEMNTWRKAGVAQGCDSFFSPRGGSLILPCGKNGRNVCVYDISRVYVGPDITVRSAIESLTNQNRLVTLLWYNFLFFEGLYQKQILCLSSFMRSARSQQRHHCWQKPPWKFRIVDQFKVNKKKPITLSSDKSCLLTRTNFTHFAASPTTRLRVRAVDSHLKVSGWVIDPGCWNPSLVPQAPGGPSSRRSLQKRSLN